jgi:Flp pilus assembly pilin Flp
MVQFMRNLWLEDEGQDLIEYTLLIAFLALATASFLGMGNNAIRGIVYTSNSQITAGSQFAGS